VVLPPPVDSCLVACGVDIRQLEKQVEVPYGCEIQVGPVARRKNSVCSAELPQCDARHTVRLHPVQGRRRHSRGDELPKL
jgi:hypothetical protein